LIEVSTGVFPGKMFSDRCKNHGWSAKFGVGTAANSSDVPNQFARGDQLSVPYAVPMMSALGIDWFRFFFCYSYDSHSRFTFNRTFKDEVLEGKFLNVNFSPSTKETTEYSFELFLSIYRHKTFFLKFKDLKARTHDATLRATLRATWKLHRVHPWNCCAQRCVQLLQK